MGATSSRTSPVIASPNTSHDTSCRDPLLACMALISTAEQAHVAGCRTPPLTPMVMHYVNAEAAAELLVLEDPPDARTPNWSRRVWVSSAADVRLLAGSGSLYWRELVVVEKKFPLRRLPVCPAVETLHLNCASLPLASLAISLRNLTGLQLYGHDRPALSALAQLPFLRSLSLIALFNLTNDELGQLEACGALEEVALMDCLSVTDLSGLASCSRLLRVDVLHEPLLKSSALALLRALPLLQRVSLCSPTDAELQALAAAPRPTSAPLEVNLRILMFAKWFTRQEAALLGALRLTKLVCQCAEHLAADVTAVVNRLPHLTSLTVLGARTVTGALRGCTTALTELSVQHVARSAFSDGLFAIPTLTSLDIHDSPHLTAVSHLDECPRLTSLRLHSCGVTNDGLVGVCAAPRLKRLTALCAAITDASCLQQCGALESATLPDSVPGPRVFGLHRTWYRD